MKEPMPVVIILAFWPLVTERTELKESCRVVVFPASWRLVAD